MRKLLLLFIALISFISCQQNGIFIPPYLGKATYNGPTKCVNVFFHIVRNDNGTEATNPINELDNTIDKLNSTFAPHKFFFINVGFSYINSSSSNIIASGNEAYILGTNIFNNPNNINIYLVDNITSAKGWSQTPGNWIVIKKSFLSNGNTISHEMGHCFGLYHSNDIDNLMSEGFVIGEDFTPIQGDMMHETASNNQTLKSVYTNCLIE